MIFLLKKDLKICFKIEFSKLFDIIYTMKLNIYMVIQCKEIGDMLWAFQ
jgi:hypothetical protein